LRNFIRGKKETAAPPTTDDSVAALAVDCSHPEWLVKRWLECFGRDAARALMSANNERAPLVLRVNSLKSDRRALLNLLERNGVTAIATQWSPDGVWAQSGSAVNELPGFHQGLFQVQGEASQLITHLLAPRPGECILDACAAPGGKTTHIAELMRDAGEVTAIDLSAKGIARIRENAARLGLISIRTLCADVNRSFAASFSRHFDRVLIDAPCSGLGTLRSHPEIKWRRKPDDIVRLSRLQAKIVDRVAACIKPGGILVYSTCTLTPEENEHVVESFLKTRKEFELQDATGYLPEQAKSMAQRGYFLALPHRHNTDGFFAARMRKVA
jgi:16S rRNA (cytosine967-C5)-methyltransferase